MGDAPPLAMPDDVAATMPLGWLDVFEHINAMSNFTFSVPLPDGPQWRVHVRRANAAMMALVRENLRFFLLTHLLGGAVLLLVMGFVYRMILMPVKQASLKAQRIANGELSQRLEYMGADELGTLSTAFNRMLAWLTEMIETSQRDQEVLAKANRDLLQKTEYLVNLQETVADGYFEWRVSSRALHLSDKLIRLFGEGVRHRLAEERWRAFVVPDELDRFFSGFYAFCKGDKSQLYSGTVVCVNGQGDRLWMQLKAGIAEYDADGAAELVVGSMEDVTQTHLQREELRVLNERTQLAAEASGSGVWDWDLVSGDLFWDSRMCALYGQDRCAPGDTYGQWISMVHLEDREGVVSALSESIRSLRPLDYSFRIVTSSGQVKPMRVLGKVLADAQGEAQRFVGMSWDMSDLNLRQGVLNQVSRRLGEWVAGLSCRVKARLVALSGCVGYLEQDVQAGHQAEITVGVDRVQQHLVSLMGEVQSMLDDARAQLESGVAPVMIDELFEQLQSAWRHSGAAVETFVDASAHVALSLPRARLKQLLAQLVTLCHGHLQAVGLGHAAMVLDAHRTSDALVMALRINRSLSFGGAPQAQLMDIWQGLRLFGANLQLTLEHGSTFIEITVPIAANADAVRLPLHQRSA